MKTKTIVTVMLLMFCAVSIFAQLATNVPPADSPVVESSDETIRAFLTKYSALKLFIVPVVTVLVMGLRKVITFIPDQIWPIVTPFIGVGLDYLASKTGLWTSSAEAGALMGGLATWFHQLGAQLRESKQVGFTYSASSKPQDTDSHGKG